MISRRSFLTSAAASGMALILPAGRASAAHAPLPSDAFPALDAQGDRPWLGLATSLPTEHDADARIEGALPAGLRGTLYRNGPGLFERGGLRKQSLLDGDGMLQVFAIGDGRVRYRNRFTRTEKLVREERDGRYRYATWTTQAPGGMLANLMGSAVANQAGVSTVARNGRLYVFDESTQPHEIDPETLDTIGLSHLGLPEGTSVYSAHSKVDARTGEWLHFGVAYGRVPTVHLTTFRRDGSLASHRTLALPRSRYLHDWFVSERHVVLHLHPAEIEIFPFLLGRSSFAGAFRWKPEQGSLLLVLPREGDAEPVRIETDAAWMWHSLNAYERGGEIVADFVGYDAPDHFIGEDPALWAIMEGRRGETSPGTLRRFVIDPAARRVTRETLAGAGTCEFPIVSPRHACGPHRFGYVVRGGERDLFWREVVRVDTRTGGSESYDFGAGVYVTEPILAPDPDDAREEAGWILSEGYDGRTRKAFLAVLRADRVADGPVAVARLEHHAPLSFHGCWSPA